MLVQSAVEMISLMETHILTAMEVDAPLIECALNLSPSIEDCFKAFNIHFANVLEVTGLCGLTYKINNCEASVNLSYLYILSDVQMDRF